MTPFDDGLRDEDVDAELKLLEYRRQDAPDTGRVFDHFDNAYGPDVRQALDVYDKLRQMRRRKPLTEQDKNTLYEEIRNGFWTEITDKEVRWVAQGLKPAKEWDRDLRNRLPQAGGLRNSLRRMVEMYASEWLNSHANG